MTEKNFTAENVSTQTISGLSDDLTETAHPNTVAVPTPLTVNHAFFGPGVVIGALGVGTNGLILYALYASKQHKKQMLIFNQNALDLFTSLWLFITYAMGHLNVYHSGVIGYWLCILITSETILYIGITGSKLNLMVITIERYLKVVHSACSKKRLRQWMKYAAMVFTWVGGAIYSVALTIPTSYVSEGRCYVVANWPSQAAYIAWGNYAFVSFYAIPLMIFTFCYAHILVTIRRQARVMAGHGSNSPHHKIQTNIISTMIVVTLFFALSNLLLEIYFLLMSSGVVVPDGVYYAGVFISFIYICTNPFIYAVKFEPVKDVLLRLTPCKAFRRPSETTQATATTSDTR